MAEDKDPKDDASVDLTGTPAKRRLRSNTETVRQRTEKFQNQQKKSDESARSGILSSFWRGFTWPIRKLGQVLAAIGRFLGRFKIFRIIGRILLPRYIRNSWRELRLVTWPDRRTSWKLTYAVIVFSVLFGLVVFGVDSVLDKLFKELFVKS
jgi:preprotein translocase subunit SecE